MNTIISHLTTFLRELVKLGVPIIFSLNSSGRVLVVRRGDRTSLFKVGLLLDPLTSRVSGLSLTLLDTGYSVKVGDVVGDGVNVDLRNLLVALGSSGNLFTVYELDLWLHRVSYINRLRDFLELNDRFRRLASAGFRVRVLEETCDYAIGVSDIIGSWVNYCTGRVDLAFEEQESQGLFKWGLLKQVYLEWLESLKQSG